VDIATAASVPSATRPSLNIPFTVSPGSDTRLVLPAPIVNHGTYFEVSGLTVSANGLDVQAVAEGTLINQLYACAAATGIARTACPGNSVAFPGMYLIGSDGQREWPAASYDARGKVWNGSVGSELGIPPDGAHNDDWLFDLPGPGRYQLVFQWSPDAGPYPSEAAANSNFSIAEASWTIQVP
jgi:hypothetical protein